MADAAQTARPGIDHIVLCARDLERARARFAALGFTLTPRAVHPFGTGNSLVQMGHGFVELLTVVAPEKIPAHGERTFSFGAFNRDFLARREGMSMLVLSTADARAEEARWRARGLATFEPLYFERMARQPDGSDAKVAFTIAFARNEAMPEAVFFCCQQHASEHFWQAPYQHHANGAADFASVTMVAPDPGAHEGFFRALVGEDAVAPTQGGLAVATALGVVEVLAPAALGARFPGVPIEACPDPRFVAAAVRVADRGAASALVEAAGVPAVRLGDRVVVPPAETFGMALELVGPAAG